jgi:phage-related tail protein
MKPAMIRPKVARLVVGAVGVALAAAMSALLAQSGALDWRAALMAAGTALGAWVVKQPWQDVLGELLEQLPPELAADVSESLRPTQPTPPPEA